MICEYTHPRYETDTHIRARAHTHTPHTHTQGVPGSGVRLGFLRAGTEVFFVELVRGR
jgi:hypothetical protein